MTSEKLSGVYVAAVTPLSEDLKPDLDAIPELLSFYFRRGCHGALLLGTTGEGPSFSPAEREMIFEAGTQVHYHHPEFQLFAGTGTPSLDETIQLNKRAFELGYDGVVVLPPYYYRSASEDGLFRWYSEVIERSIPKEGYLLGYHFPNVSGVALPESLLQRLGQRFPVQFGGIKDSSGDLKHTQTLASHLPQQSILVGNDRYMTAGLQAGSAGCITALANLVSPLLRRIYDSHQRGETASEEQEIVNQARNILDGLSPFPPSIKALLAEMHGFPLWPVKPPLEPFDKPIIEQAARQLQSILG
ncbi:MAG: dihydrodipicolinate synthase family protein [Anaerolineales bacterium]